MKLHKKVYEDMGISDYWYRLSLPDFKNNKEKYGDVKNKAMWEKGSAVLRKALKETGHKFVEAHGEATFYGPKSDIQIKDIYGKEESIATIQVDYYSAGKFNLNYISKDGKEKSVIIVHRAIFGSFDRFFAFLIEKTSGNLPVWLAPIQVKILAVSDKHSEYAESINKKIMEAGLRSEVEPSDETLGKRIRQAEMQRIPYIAVVGDEEVKAGTMSIRVRGGGTGGQVTPESLNETIRKQSDKLSS